LLLRAGLELTSFCYTAGWVSTSISPPAEEPIADRLSSLTFSIFDQKLEV